MSTFTNNKNISIIGNRKCKLVIFIICTSLTLTDVYLNLKAGEHILSIINTSLFIFGSAVLVLPVENLKRVGANGTIFEIRKNTDENTRRIEELHNILRLYIELTMNHNKIDHLSNLIKPIKVPYETGETLKEELRDLRSVGFIKPKNDCRIDHLPRVFIFNEYFEISEKGKTCFDLITKLTPENA